MTTRAIAIKGLVTELTGLAMEGPSLRLAIAGQNQLVAPDEAMKILLGYQCNIQAYLVAILEKNPEQAEALMQELNLKWVIPPGSVPPEQQ